METVSRMEEKKKRVIATAAELAGQTLTQYVMGLVWPDAERRVAENYRIKISQRDWDEFTARLDAPPKDLPASIVETGKQLPGKLRFFQ